MRTSYSRRELYALGEPLGDSATYLKADGGLILGDGGGSSAPAPASSTTQTQDLPDWAKPYAQDVLSKGKAVTDLEQNPYQPYGASRIAGFDPMQTQAFQGAQNMRVAPQIGQATAASVGAGLGGFDVAGQSTTGGFQNQVGGYMNPYLQYSLAPQLAEANRQYDIGAVNQQSKATQAGAFGGSREAIMAAENERNRNMGLQSIVGQGYNTAFTNAQNQYNQNLQNQLAGYGVANQAAGQLGNLGQSQYQQGMGINALQAQYGGQQQAQEQRGLDTAYQDFLTQKNYPYQQLSYMSNLVRGTPMGMNTQSQVYQAPPSTMGQLAGLGMGAYGLSRMAEGGLAFGEGGDISDKMNDPAAMAAQVDKLSDEQLQSIIQNPTTQVELVAAQQELAMRASERGGMAGAYNQLPQGQQQGVVQAAGGGILAFADRGAVEDKEPTQEEIEAAKKPYIGYRTPPRVAGQPPKEYSESNFFKGVGEFLVPSKYAVDKPKQEAPKPTLTPPTSVDGDPYNAATATRRVDFETKDKPKVSPEIFSGITKLSKDSGVPAVSLMDEFVKMRDMLKAESKGDMDTLNKLMEKSAGRSKEIKDKGFGKALAEFGFQMAANAAEPGQTGNKGLSGVLRSAAKASPTLAASISKTNELAQAADDNQQKLAIAMRQFEMAQRKGDNATALGFAAQIRQFQQVDKQIAVQREQLDVQRQQYASQAGLGAAQLAQKERQFDSLMDYRNKAAGAQGLAAQARMADVRRRATLDFDNNPRNTRKEAELIQQYGPIQGKYQFNQMRQSAIGDAMNAARDQRGDMASATGGDTKSVFDLLND
jgi:hypothetical protein